jgi:excisionase family DNA binding protein
MDVREVEADELVRLAVAARRFGVSPQTLRRMIHDGEVDAIRLGGGAGRQLRIRTTEIRIRLDEWATTERTATQ